MKSTLKNVLLGAGAVVALLVVFVVVAFLTLDPQKLVTEKKDALLKDISARIGRTLTSGDVKARVGASLGATIEDVELSGPPGENGAPGPAQLSIRQIDVQLSLLRALLSFGRDLHVERFTIDGLVLRLARDGDGRWDFQDILDKTAGTPDDADPSAPSSAGALSGLRIAALNVRDAHVDLNDAVLGRPLAIDTLNVGVSDVVLGDPLAVWLTANLVDGGKTSSVDVRAKLAVLPKDLSFDPLPDLDVAVKLNDVDLGPWGGLLPATSPAPVAGVVRADVTTKLTKNTDVVDVNGTVMVRGLQLRDALGAVASAAERRSAPRGTPLDLDLGVALHLDPDQTRLDKLSLQGSGIAVDGTLTHEGAGLAGLRTAAVTAKIAQVEKLLMALPPSLRGLPPEVAIDGPLDATLTKNGDALAAAVVLDGARVRYRAIDEVTGAESAAFDKPAGKALHLQLSGKDTGKALDVDRFALVLDTVTVGGTLSLPQDPEAPLVADVHSGAIALSTLQGLVPPFREAIGRGQKVDGTIGLDVNAKSAGGKQEAHVELSLKRMDVNLASLIVKGQGGLTVKAAPGADGVAVVAAADLDGLSIQKVDGGATSLNKPAGLPLRLDADVKKGADAATINSVKLVVGKSAVSGKGTVRDLGKRSENLHLDFGVVDLAFDDLRQALPGASKLPAGGRLKGALALKGGLSAAALTVDARDLDVAFGGSRIRGDVNVSSLDAPKLDVNLSSVVLAFDDVRPLSESLGDLPKGGRFDGALVMKGDTARSSTVVVDVKIDRFSAAGSDLKGTMKVTDLANPRFVLSTQSDSLDVDALSAAFGSGDDVKKGPKQQDDNPHGLSKSTRATLATVSGKATLQAKRAKVRDMILSNFTGVLVMNRGVVKFEKLEFGFYGGAVTASGTSLDLPAESLRYDLRLDAKNVDFGAFMADQAAWGKLLKGTVSPSLTVKGKGIAAGDFAATAEGPAELVFKSLNVASLDVLGPLGDAMKKTGKAGSFNAAAAPESKGGLSLSNFTALTRLVGGKMKLEKPIEADTPMGKMKIEGATGLDARLDFKGTLQLTPAMIGKLTGGKVKVKDPVPVPMRIGGTWDKPQVTGVEIDKLLAAIVGDQAKQVLDKGKDAAEEAVRDAVGNLLGGGKDKDKDKKKRKKR